jgi:hypothetical protein
MIVEESIASLLKRFPILQEVVELMHDPERNTFNPLCCDVVIATLAARYWKRDLT